MAVYKGFSYEVPVCITQLLGYCIKITFWGGVGKGSKYCLLDCQAVLQNQFYMNLSLKKNLKETWMCKNLS